MTNDDPSTLAAGAKPQATFDRRSIMVGLGLAAGAGLSYFHTPRAMAAPISEDRFQQLIPARIGGWTSRKSAELVVPAEDEGQDKLYENLETRIYEGEGLPPMMLLIAYSSVQRNDVQVHRPEVCYPAAGFPILWSKPTTIDVGGRKLTGRELVASRGGVNERIIYWVRVGDEFPIGWAEQRLTMALSNAKGVTPDGVLFRVSMIESDPEVAARALRTFIKAFMAASTSSFRENVLF
ncbi:MAG: exosortase-associated protein EpsI, V-type [Sphingopyxis solisilvae]|uniref:exosortase-associated protein EpsI, V-type n=1 Tax=Sphingopyxis solisilvae TaxID=1886788 RepID=UPI0040365FD9